MATYNVMQCDNAAIIKYKIKHIRIHTLKHTYAKFNLHWYIRRLFVKLALKLLID